MISQYQQLSKRFYKRVLPSMGQSVILYKKPHNRMSISILDQNTVIVDKYHQKKGKYLRYERTFNVFSPDCAPV